MLGELTVACNALTASGTDVFAGNKGGTDLVLSAATTQGAQTRGSCSGRGAIETTTHDTSGRYDRREGHGRGGRGGRYGGRDQCRYNYVNWRHGGRGDGHNSGDSRRDEYARSHDARNYETRNSNRGDGRGRANSSNSRRRSGCGCGD